MILIDGVVRKGGIAAGQLACYSANLLLHDSVPCNHETLGGEGLTIAGVQPEAKKKHRNSLVSKSAKLSGAMFSWCYVTSLSCLFDTGGATRVRTAQREVGEGQREGEQVDNVREEVVRGMNEGGLEK